MKKIIHYNALPSLGGVLRRKEARRWAERVASETSIFEDWRSEAA